MAKESCEQESLLVATASSPQAEMKWLVTHESRRYLQTWGCVQMGPRWQPDPRGKSSERAVISVLGHLHENFRAFALLSLHLWKRCLKQASALARNFHNLPGTLPTLETLAASLKIWLRKHKSQLRAKWTLCEPFCSLAWVQCADDVFSVGRG